MSLVNITEIVEEFEKIVYPSIEHLGTLSEDALERAFNSLTKHEKGCIQVASVAFARMVKYDKDH